MKLIPHVMIKPFSREKSPRTAPPAPAEAPAEAVDLQQRIRQESVVSARAVAEAIENAKVDLQKYLRPEPGCAALSMEDAALITEELSVLQAMLQSIHSDENTRRLDETLALSFRATLPYYFQFGKREDWTAAIAELKQAIALRIGDSDQIRSANVDLLILHCRAKDLYYDCMLYLNCQKLDRLRADRKQLILNDASETDIKQIAGMIGTTENEHTLYERAKSANLVKLSELQEHKHLCAEQQLFTAEMTDAIDRIITGNTEMMISISEQIIADTHTSEKMIANRDAVNSVILNQLTDSAPTLSGAARRMQRAEQAQTEPILTQEPQMHAQ